MKIVLNILYKDLLCEIRTRHVIYSLLVFVLTTVFVLLFSISDNEFTVDLSASLFWVVSFFSTMTGLSRSFVLEEEKQTILFLRLNATPEQIYLGKLFYSIVVNLIINITITFAFILFIPTFVFSNLNLFILTILVSSISISSAVTILSAIISKAENKGLLLPFLSFPILLPILITSINLTKLSLGAFSFENEANYLQFMISYSVVLITASLLFIKYIFEE
ncbi:MAG: heme exporter protein CcmB [Bacteroidetes bacterium]|nr:heme exporter protein CcmB [Bacteroidota bacterium]